MSSPLRRERHGCSRETSLPLAGRSVMVSSWISENETLFNLIGTTYGGDGCGDLRASGPARVASRSTSTGTTGCHSGPDGRGGDGDAHAEPPDSVAPAIRRPPWPGRSACGRQSGGKGTAQTRVTPILYVAGGRPEARQCRQTRLRAGAPRAVASHTKNMMPFECINFIPSHSSLGYSPVVVATGRIVCNGSVRLAEIRILACSTSRPQAGRYAMASSCRSARTPRSFRSSARPMAVTASRPSRFRTCRTWMLRWTRPGLRA